MTGEMIPFITVQVFCDMISEYVNVAMKVIFWHCAAVVFAVFGSPCFPLVDGWRLSVFGLNWDECIYGYICNSSSSRSSQGHRQSRRPNGWNHRTTGSSSRNLRCDFQTYWFWRRLWRGENKDKNHFWNSGTPEHSSLRTRLCFCFICSRFEGNTSWMLWNCPQEAATASFIHKTSTGGLLST